MKLLTMQILCILIAFSAQAQTWQPIGPYGGNINVVAAHPTDANIVLVGTDMGVYRSLDTGETWQATSTTGWIGAIAFAPDNPDVVYVGGNNLYKSTDGGGIWEQVPSSPGDEIRALALSDSNTVYIGTRNGLLFNPGGGQLWGWAGLDGEINAIEIDPTDPNTIYVATSTSNDEPTKILKTTDAGEHWTVSLDVSSFPDMNDDFSCLAIDPRDSRTIYAGEGFHLYKSVDAGGSWSRIFSVKSKDHILAIAISPGDDNRVYITTTWERGYWSEDEGNTWTEWTLGDNLNFSVQDLAINSKEASTLYAATNSGFYKSNDAGSSWTEYQTGLPGIYTYSLAVDPLNEKTIYASAAELSVVKTVDGGATWQQAASAGQQMWILLFSPRDRNVLYAGGGSLYRSIDGAQTWESFQGTGGDVCSIAFAPSDTRIAYAVSLDGHSIYKSIDGGHFWNVIPVTGWRSLGIIVDVANPEMVFAFMYKDEGGQWLRRSTDGGFTWENIYQFGWWPNDIHITSYLLWILRHQVQFILLMETSKSARTLEIPGRLSPSQTVIICRKLYLIRKMTKLSMRAMVKRYSKARIKAKHGVILAPRELISIPSIQTHTSMVACMLRRMLESMSTALEPKIPHHLLRHQDYRYQQRIALPHSHGMPIQKKILPAIRFAMAQKKRVIPDTWT